MSTTTPTRFGPYATRAELAKGRRKAVLGLAVTVVAVTLAVIASRSAVDQQLVTVYLLAGGIHFVASLAASIRWSRTPDFET